MKNIKEIVLSILVAAGVILTLFFYLMGTGEIEFNQIVLVGIALLLVGLAMYIIWDKIRNVQKGLPGKDERTISMSHKAGYYGFIAAIWSAVFIPLFFDVSSVYELDGGDVSAIVVLVSAFEFIVSYLYFYWKGN